MQDEPIVRNLRQNRKRDRLRAPKPSGEAVECEIRDGLAFVTLSRPESGNALSAEMHEELRRVLTALIDDARLEGVVITGAGAGFCAGAESSISGVTTLLRRTHKPVIAAINGWVDGPGLELALACDARIASDRACFGSLDWAHGLPYNGRTKALVQRVGMQTAKQLVLRRSPVAADWALRHHVVGRVVAPDRLLPEAGNIARSIRRSSCRAA